MDFFIQLFTDPVTFYNSHELLLAQIGINAILAISLFVTFYSGQLTLANAGFMAVGAYTTVILNLYTPLPLPLDILAGTALAGAVGFLVGLPVLRLRGIFLAIATIGFVEALRLGVILHVPITGEGQGLTTPRPDPHSGIPRTTSSSSRGPEPAAWLNITDRCRSARSAGPTARSARAPNPVVTP